MESKIGIKNTFAKSSAECGLKAIHTPDSPFAALLDDGLAINLDYEIEHRGDDGAWSPYWTYGDAFGELGPMVVCEWKGVLTLPVKTLRNFGRLA